jgi:hypothetical protein
VCSAGSVRLGGAVGARRVVLLAPMSQYSIGRPGAHKQAWPVTELSLSGRAEQGGRGMESARFSACTSHLQNIDAS